MEKTPLVSIKCTVFNHEPFLRQCLDGFVMQKTSFPFEAIVHDDASTDGSVAIIREYAERYPDIIKPIYETENQYSKKDGSIIRIMNAAIHSETKYIALCEGDDYWTDPFKLQRQVDFLENHPQFFVCSHNFSILNQFDLHKKEHLIDVPYHDCDGYKIYIYNKNNYFKVFAASTLSVVYRNIHYLDSYYMNKGLWDFTNRYLMMKKGDGALLKDSMATYRVHENGIYSGRSIEERYNEELRQLYLLYIKEKDRTIIKDAINPRMIAFLSYLKYQKCYKEMTNNLLIYCKRIPITKQFDLYFNLAKMLL